MPLNTAGTLNYRDIQPKSNTGFQGGRPVTYVPGGGFIQQRSGGGGGSPEPFSQQQQQMWGFINNPGQAITNYQQTLPQVSPLQYGTGAFNLGDTLQGGQGGGQPQSQPQLNVTSGIQAPPINPIPQPQAAGIPGLGNISPLAQQAAQASFGQQSQPQLAQLLSQYYPAQQGLTDATGQAQAASGLGWAGLGSQAFNQASGNQVAQNSQLLQFLQGARGIFG